MVLVVRGVNSGCLSLGGCCCNRNVNEVVCQLVVVMYREIE